MFFGEAEEAIGHIGLAITTLPFISLPQTPIYTRLLGEREREREREGEMGYEEEPKEPNFASPKSLLFLQRFIKPELQGGCSPPPHTVATVPFQWEVAPGKPRSTTDPPQRSKSFTSLHLPPKMFTNYAKVGIISSPTNVLDGPYSSYS